MANILKMALCPAPFQKSKKKGDKKAKEKKLVDGHLQHILPDTLIPSFNGSSSHLRSSSNSPHSSASSSPHQPLRSAYSQQSDFRVAAVGHGAGCRGECACNSSSGTQTSGYQSDYHSGYVTDSNGASFEAQMLAKATKDRPANLRMTAIRDYSPGCNEELSVRKGQRVRVLYRNHDWVFAVTKHGQSGFIPYTYVRPSRKYNGYQSEPEITRIDDSYMSGYETDMMSTSSRFQFPPTSSSRPIKSRRDAPQVYSIDTGCRRVGSGSPVQAHVDVFDNGYMSAIEGPTYHTATTNRYRPTTDKPSTDSFQKSYLEELVVIHDFVSLEENEVSVSKGERVKVLNASDSNWLWVVTTRKMEEGFIPRLCCTLGNHPSLSTNMEYHRNRTRHTPMDHSSSRRQHPTHHYARHHQHYRNMRLQARDRFKQLAMARENANPALMDKEEIKKVGTKLIVLMDYEAVSPDELSVEFAETLLADILAQNGVERLWAYCPRTDACGYVPMSMVVPPVV